ncbi:MAG: hypothetical protein QG635_2112, partial [Bacteroidota bacterium]|nr:hypothetical protein [Bacteroidota bacterium]
MYVNDSESGKIYKYELKSDTTIRKASVFASVGAEIDGIKTDLDGNVYVAVSNEGIRIYNYLGVKTATIPIPEKTRNLAWGGKYGNILFVTAGESLYRVYLKTDNPFIMNEYLGRPTDKSIVLNMLSEKDIDLYVQYGLNPDKMEKSTNIVSYKADIPIEVLIDNLSANTKYYYKVLYKISGEDDFFERRTGSFHTQRQKNNSFVFDVQADPHLDNSSNYITYSKAMENTLADEPDFMIEM